MLAHAKRLRAIAEADPKSDELDAELLARMLQAGLIPRVHPKSADLRERARLVRHRALLVRQRTMLLNRIHAQLHPVGLSLPRGRLNTRAGRAWLIGEALPKLGPEQRRLVRTHPGSIPAGANRWLRGVLVRAVASHCRRSEESSLSRYYARQKERLGWPTARVAAARKLCRAMYQMLQTGEVWRGWARDGSAANRGELRP